MRLKTTPIYYLSSLGQWLSSLWVSGLKTSSMLVIIHRAHKKEYWRQMGLRGSSHVPQRSKLVQTLGFNFRTHHTQEDTKEEWVGWEGRQNHKESNASKCSLLK